MVQKTRDIGTPAVRRSRRMLMSERICVRGTRTDGRPFEEQTNTISVNAHGALLLLEVPVVAGQALILAHKMDEEELEAQVVDNRNKFGAKTQVAVQFLAPAPRFWRVAFPPADWVSF